MCVCVWSNTHTHTGRANGAAVPLLVAIEPLANVNGVPIISLADISHANMCVRSVVPFGNRRDVAGSSASLVAGFPV